MKKTFPVNINGSIFYIDEDAYELLNTYLDQLHTAFPGAEGSEIIEDIESRIAELFNERIASGAGVIILAHVNDLIETLGRPAEIAEPVAETFHPANSQESTPGPDDDTTQAPRSETPPPFDPDQNIGPVRKRLYRDERNKVFGGVLSGLGIYLGWNITIMRVLYVILCCTTYFWPLFIIYMLAWMIIPPARTPRQILEMTGSPVTLKSLGQTILGTSDAGPIDPGTSVINSAAGIIGKIMLAILGLIGICVGIGALIWLFISICALILYCGWGSFGFLTECSSMFEWTASPILCSLGFIFASIALLIPSVAAIWGGCCALFNARGASRTFIITTAIVEVILIIVATVMLNVASFTISL